MLTKTKTGDNFSLVTDVENFSAPASFSRGENGNLVVTNTAVFRSGTFRNSWGEQVTYEPVHIDQMVSNFNFLKDSGTFASVPVRIAHAEPYFRNSTEEVIGYVSGLTSEDRAHPGTGVNYRYLISTYEILDEAAAAKIEKGLFRNRSAEVGTYADNNDTEFYPTLLGFAYVDIPAVEGLNFGKRADVRRFAMEDGELPVDEDNKGEEEATVEPEVVEPVEAEPEVIEPVESEAEVESETASPEEEIVEEPESEVEETVTVPPVVSVTENPSGTFGKGTDNFGIEINGVKVTDPAIIQQYVNNLQMLHVTDRKAYVKGLFNAKKIFAQQEENLEEFAASLTTEQWGAFRKIYDESPAIGAIAFQADTQPVPSKEQAHDALVASEVEAHLRRALGEEKFMKTDFYLRTHESDKEGNNG